MVISWKDLDHLELKKISKLREITAFDVLKSCTELSIFIWKNE